MANRFTASEVIQLLDDDDFGLPREEESDFEGDEVASYLPRSELEISEEQNLEEDLEEAMEVEDTEDTDVMSEYDESSDEDSSNQPLGKSICTFVARTNNYRINFFFFLTTRSKYQ